MPRLDESEARALLERVLKLSKAEACEANLNGTAGGNVRYARNAVSTAGAVENATLVVQSSFGNRSGTSTANQFDDASLERVVRASEELAKLAPEDPEFMPPMGQQQYVASDAYVEATAAIAPDARAAAAAASIGPAKAKGCVAAGFMQDSGDWQAMMNTAGLFAYARSTSVNFTVTMRTEDGAGSGWASQDSNDVRKVDPAAASAIAIEKALASRDAKAIEPGKYTVVLEPAAVVDLLQYLPFSMNARSADEGRSFMSKPGGGTKLGEKLVDERVTIYSDPAHKEVPVAPWAQDGRALAHTAWIENGVAKNLYYSRFWAKKQGKPATPAPANLIMDGGTASLEELIRGTERGVLVTRLWYIRPVDPQTLLYTGLTRDGTFYIENGQIRHAVKNFRFNESPVIMLNNLDALGQSVRVSNAETGVPSFLPSMRIRDFTFSSLSDAV
jgi:predicted Zn-dependent protease